MQGKDFSVVANAKEGRENGPPAAANGKDGAGGEVMIAAVANGNEGQEAR